MWSSAPSLTRLAPSKSSSVPSHWSRLQACGARGSQSNGAQLRGRTLERFIIILIFIFPLFILLLLIFIFLSSLYLSSLSSSYLIFIFLPSLSLSSLSSSLSFYLPRLLPYPCQCRSAPSHLEWLRANGARLRIYLEYLRAYGARLRAYGVNISSELFPLRSELGSIFPARLRAI